jgi:hypothetical protein
VQSPGTAGLDGYLLHYDNGRFQIWRVDDTAQTQLGADVTQTLGVDDSFGFQAIGNTLKGYYKASGGSWTEIINRTDSAYGAAGYIGTAIENSAPDLDDFGGGTVSDCTADDGASVTQIVTTPNTAHRFLVCVLFQIQNRKDAVNATAPVRLIINPRTR